MQEEQADKYK